jgi:hypothetical protein
MNVHGAKELAFANWPDAEIYRRGRSWLLLQSRYHVCLRQNLHIEVGVGVAVV